MGVLLLCSHDLWFWVIRGGEPALSYVWVGWRSCAWGVLWGVGVLLGALGNLWGGRRLGRGLFLGAGSGAGGFCGFGEVSKNTC